MNRTSAYKNLEIDIRLNWQCTADEPATRPIEVTGGNFFIGTSHGRMMVESRHTKKTPAASPGKTGGDMTKTIAVILSCLFFTVCLSGCLEQGIQVEADAQRKDPGDLGLLPALFQFNISNLVHQDITNIDMDIVFFKINEHELSKYLVNTRFYGEKTTLAPGETSTYYCETYLDPQLSPLNISRIWGTEVHWQMTFKISWEAQRIYTTTRTFNWEFPGEGMTPPI